MMTLMVPLIAMSQALAAPPYWVRSIAPAYRGDWTRLGQRCAPGPARSGNMRISARTISTFKSRFDVRRTQPVATSSMDVEGRTHHGRNSFGNRVRLTLIVNSTRGENELGVGDWDKMDIYVRCRR